MEGSQTDRKCPKCSGAMEVGFLRDRQQGGVHNESAEWVQGPPERGWLTGVKTSSKTRYRITAFRCEKCGFLEQYADGPPLTRN